jgi:hypothetical protein
MKTRILRNTFISVSVLSALPLMLTAGSNEEDLNFSDMPLVHRQPTLITFDVPGATGTFPMGINPAGVITGYYLPAGSFEPHGFLRAPDGTITTLDLPGAVGGTTPSGINPAGTITGTYCDEVTCHGFLRAPDGTITTFDVPGSGYTAPVGINPSGTITGDYCDLSFTVCHSFVRSPDGSFTSFDPFFIINLSGIINPKGTITGYYPDAVFLFHGFVRERDNTVTIFDVPGVCQTSNGTFATGINPAGVVVGSYLGSDCVAYRGFVRSPDGTITTFDFPGADDTEPSVINPAGAIAGGYFVAGDPEFHNFLRTPSGRFVSFSTPGPAGITAINTAGVITGSWSEPQNFDVSHGFVWIP